MYNMEGSPFSRKQKNGYAQYDNIAFKYVKQGSLVVPDLK